MTDLPFLREPGALYAAGPDAHEPYAHDDEWTLIGRTEPGHCSAQGSLWELGLDEVNLLPTPAAPFAVRAKLSWDSDDGTWRVIASVRAPEPGSVPMRRPTVTIWPVWALLEAPVRVLHLEEEKE